MAAAECMPSGSRQHRRLDVNTRHWDRAVVAGSRTSSIPRQPVEEGKGEDCVAGASVQTVSSALSCHRCDTATGCCDGNLQRRARCSSAVVTGDDVVSAAGSQAAFGGVVPIWGTPDAVTSRNARARQRGNPGTATRLDRVLHYNVSGDNGIRRESAVAGLAWSGVAVKGVVRQVRVLTPRLLIATAVLVPAVVGSATAQISLCPAGWAYYYDSAGVEGHDSCVWLSGVSTACRYRTKFKRHSPSCRLGLQAGGNGAVVSAPLACEPRTF